MIATFTSAGWRDFNQRYHNVFGYFPKEDGSEVLVYMEKVGETRCTFRDKDDLTYYAQADMGVNFKFIPITKRVFMMGGYPYLAQRVPARQYRRGVCGDNTRITNLVNGRGQTVDFDSVVAYTTPVVNADNARYSVYEGMFTFCKNDKVLIYDQSIATMADNAVFLYNQLFKQELLDCIRRNNLPYTIV